VEAPIDGRGLFDIPDDITFLNCAFVSPWLRASKEALRIGLAREAEPWNLEPDDFFTPVDELRAAFAALVDASAEDIAIVPSVSYGVASAAKALAIPADSNIVVVAGQYPSNYYSWHETASASGAEIRVATPESPTGLTTAVLAAIDQNTSLVTVPNCHWMSGAAVELGEVAAKARSVGAALAVDGSQSIGAMPFSIADLDPDFVFACGYKWLLGPYALSFLYVAKRHQDASPLESNPLTRARAIDFTNLANYRDEFQPGARRFDTGERAYFTLLPASLAALQQLREWTIPRVADTINARVEAISEEASRIGFEVLPRQARAPHFGSLRARSALPESLARDLVKRRIFVSVRGEFVRVTPHVFTTDADVDRFLAALAELTQ